jgi:hypothetical protein
LLFDACKWSVPDKKTRVGEKTFRQTSSALSPKGTHNQGLSCCCVDFLDSTDLIFNVLKCFSAMPAARSLMGKISS